MQFKLQSNILWSDGNPLTAEDSQLSYETAARLFPDVNPDVASRALNVDTFNPSTIIWGKTAGYVPPDTIEGSFMPLPENAWDHLHAQELFHAGTVDRPALEWEAYVGETATQDFEAAKAVLINENDGYRVISIQGLAWERRAGEAQI